MRSVAVVMTAHNRREMTVRSVSVILNQEDSRTQVRVYVTDDGSTDGTRAALLQLDDRVTVVEGDGQLYWAAGMAVAERAAMGAKPDFLLWLNDDTIVDPHGLDELMRVAEAHPDTIVVGSTRDPDSGRPTYGGRRRLSSWHPQRFERVPISDQIQRADTFNGNLVLVPRRVRERVGPIDDLFPHAYADDDYGLRATAHGVAILQAPGTLATCRANAARLGERRDRGVQGWRARQSPKQLPWRAQIRYLRRHGGPTWPFLFAAQQARAFLGR